MRKISLAAILASAAWIVGCTTHTAVSYTIRGEDPSFVDGRWMYVLSYAGGRETVIDSARIEHHAFTMKGRYAYPVSAFLYMGRDTDGVQISASDFILESGELVVEKPAEGIFMLAGTPQNDLYNDLPLRMAEIEASGRPALQCVEARDSLVRAIVLGNRNMLALSLLDASLLWLPGEEVSALLDSLPGTMQQHPAMKDLRERIDRMRTDVGRPYVDISGLTPEGDTLSLGEVIRRPGCRYLLLDFGALWCSPCREEFPNLAALHEKYAARGFQIFGVSFDVSPERWRECIETYGMKWPQVHPGFGRAPRQTKAWNDYALDGIPACFLIDARDGRILAKNLRGEALAQQVAQLMD